MSDDDEMPELEDLSDQLNSIRKARGIDENSIAKNIKVGVINEKNNAKEQRIKNMKIITKWLKRKHEIEKDKNLKRRNELLKHIINNKIKSNKYSLKFPLRFWKRIASIMTDNIKAKTIQKFWRGYLGKKKIKN